mgnify:CR=1 FL=1
MRNISATVFAAALLVGAASVEAAPSNSANPAYVGIWSVDAAKCKVPQDRQGAPMILRRKRYDQHEAHCSFRSVRRSSNAWWVSAQCTVEGSKQSDRFTLRMKGDTLVMSHGKQSVSMKRCK